MLQRRGTSAEWASANPVLDAGEIGYETNTKVIKIGDGVTPWNTLLMPYINRSGDGMTGPLTLVEPTEPNHAARLVDIPPPPEAGGTVNVRIPNGKNVNAAPTTYPLGLSTASVTTTNGWPVDATVHTIRNADTGYASQVLVRREGYLLFFRASNAGETAWLAFREVLHSGGGTIEGILNFNSSARLRANDGSQFAPSFGFVSSTNWGMFKNSDGLGFSVGGTTRFILAGGSFYPNFDGAYELGFSARRYSSVWASNGVIQTSDVTEKENVVQLDYESAIDRVVRIAEEAAISFSWPDGSRTHTGFDAAKVGDIHGDASAAYIDPTFEAKKRQNPKRSIPPKAWLDEQEELGLERSEALKQWEVEYDEFDKQTVEMATSPKGLRYNEMIPDLYVIIAEQKKQIDTLTQRIISLENGVRR
jgi:hypothetical protein